MNFKKIYDVIVAGGGHAGCEAALAAARMGAKTLLLTSTIDSIGQMSCNPAIGGLAKGNLVKDIDALGGEIAKNIDDACIQFQMLNSKKGAAAKSSRGQADKKIYIIRMINTLMSQSNLEVKQGEASKIYIKDNEVYGIGNIWGEDFKCKKAIICTGTFLNGKVFIGETSFPAGRTYEKPSIELSKSLKELGFTAIRLKTGTPARIDIRTIDFSKLEVYEMDGEKIPFSFENESFKLPQIKCYATYTNEETHKIVKENIHRSIYYNSADKGIGPRYCPSMEDKIAKFPERTRHQIILEREGGSSNEVYPNGFSTSLPVDAQIKAYRTIKGLENCQLIRPAYAIEYEAFQPTILYPSYETKIIKGLYFAGQINGTSGYEEAACQGLMAGINAVLSIDNKEPFILGRNESYIGVLTDDLITKGVDEPYRMFTSRGEYRLHLREDNAEYRLIEYGYKYGLISKRRYERFILEKEQVYNEVERFRNETIRLKDNKEKLEKYNISLDRGLSIYEFLKRPETNIDMIYDMELTTLTGRAAKQVETIIKYSGYISLQEEEIKKYKSLEDKKIPDDFDYSNIAGLRREYREKFSKIKPKTLGQALRIPGMSISAVSILEIAINKEKRNNG
ncbi:tRNA uridine-5-carboxymethylaminomethyl(34) synthesis enzyme MnmG [Mucispirillum schaedleri]|jgi:tRNA uridine 5-carboxymethylaminomethyl modification enzyme|uniref:tRNA uridine 5-carboxymethylaminomethyl modification enzyme MnmG n=1 Tax=Mucispirillum schaedleri ASF457 TaxID=1379858 RepID=V2QC82_9BACT|nr:tRNA uridine-5-carboxymethylaminomethyl(34) synthesis enzyme MnmG [Mucispirillum schaedleri]MCX4360935.1 tRNA uridine-5-carboxymethylaminomethyl(34) synthesis enzyme MnmG [Mucispirillum schaedleri]USF24248.1 tRNA uridine 5-carboxymethylaminomethyl modification enzyme MnmG [Mucispirillum schaedleri ASF457]SIW06023.1 glucose-inhibited cell-division protein [Mucispirillum schaedleri ASF457]